MKKLKCSKEEYFDKVMGYWMGKNAGGTLDTPIEKIWGNKTLFALDCYLEIHEGGIPSDNSASIGAQQGKVMADVFPITKKGPAWDGSRNDPSGGEKGMLSKGGISVPFIASWPGTIPFGQRFSDPVITLDMLFNLKEDKEEQHNLISRYPEKAEELHRKLEKWVDQMKSAGLPAKLGNYQGIKWYPHYFGTSILAA